MKKESLSNMTVKTLLAVIIFAGVGTIIIGGAYLIGKQGKVLNNKPTTMVVPEKCINAGKEISPEEYSKGVRCCFGLKGVQTSRHSYPCNPGENICSESGCSIPPPTSDGSPWRQCVPCGNGICEIKYGENRCNCPEDCAEKEVTITTGKIEYEQGEAVKITMKNGLDNPIKHLKGAGCGLQGFSNGEWISASSKSCKWDGEDKLKPSSEYNFSWTASKSGLEKYRIVFHYQEQKVIETKEIGKIICESKDISEELEKLLLSGDWIKGNDKGCETCYACGCSCVAKDVWIIGEATIDINYVSCSGNSYTIKYKGEEYNCVPENYKPLFEQASLYSKVPEGWETIYSNEFTIKEKSAVDARCGEKVKDLSGVGDVNCAVMSFGYEYDSLDKKCVAVSIRGCSMKTPFNSLGECQEVCEKKSFCNWCGRHCIEYPISEDDCKVADGIFDKQCACPEVVLPKGFLCGKENGKCVAQPIQTHWPIYKN